MTRDESLANAIAHLIRGRGGDALAEAQRWPGDWLARVVSWIAYSFFLYEPALAMDLYGGIPQFQAVASSDTVERWTLTGFGKLFRRERDAALDAWHRAVALAPDDKLVLLGWFMTAQLLGASLEERAEVTSRLSADMSHPAFHVAVALRNRPNQP